MKRIKIIAHRVDERLCGHIRIDQEAERKLLQLARQTGLSKRYLASQIIIQGAELVEIEEGEQDGR